jgi:hypothetical protein
MDGTGAPPLGGGPTFSGGSGQGPPPPTAPGGGGRHCRRRARPRARPPPPRGPRARRRTPPPRRPSGPRRRGRRPPKTPPLRLPPRRRPSRGRAAAPVLSPETADMAPVPELAAKKAKREEAWAAQRAAEATEARAKAKETRRVIFKKAAAYVNEYRQQVRRAGGRGTGALRPARACPPPRPLSAAGGPRGPRRAPRRARPRPAGEGPDPAEAGGQGRQGLLRGA